MNNELRAALYYLGKYVNDHPVKSGEWLTFTVNMLKQDGAVKLTAPCLTVGVVNTNEHARDDDVVILNEFHYGDEAENKSG